MQTEAQPKLKVLDIIKARIGAGWYLRRDHMMFAGRVLLRDGEEAMLEYAKPLVTQEPDNMKKSVQCHVVAVSRPFTEWPIYKVSQEVQKHVYALSESELEGLPEKRGVAIDAWFEAVGLVRPSTVHVQALNLIFGNARNTWEGVVTKVERANKRAQAKLERKNDKRAEEGLPLLEADPIEPATNDAGFLNHPPGPNPAIFCYQQVAPKGYNTSRFPDIVLKGPLHGYQRDTSAPIAFGVVQDRTTIPKGQPGYVPEWARLNLSTRKRRRLRNRGRSPHDALLVGIQIDQDWVLLDARGLLRHAKSKGLARHGISLDGLLGLFTQDPVIDPVRNVVTFAYKLGVIPGRARKPVKAASTTELLKHLTTPSDDGLPRHIGVLTVDLGQTNPVSAAVYRLSQNEDGNLVPSEALTRFFLPSEEINQIASYRRQYDMVKSRLRKEAVASLPAEVQAEIVRWETYNNLEAKASLCREYNLDPERLPWESMTSNTTFITDMILDKTGDRSLVFFQPPPKNGKARPEVKRKDATWAKLFRPKLTPEVRKALEDARRVLEKASPEWQRLVTWKRELSRRCVNYSVRQARKWTQCEEVVVVIEDLPFKKMFHGTGKRDPGWDNFFVHKRENRFFMGAFHKAFTELGKLKGTRVLEVCPARTSITCPSCRYCFPDNRFGEKFRCLRCGAVGNADSEVATHNLLVVALTGKPLPRYAKSSDKKSPGTARKPRKSAKSKGSMGETEGSLRGADGEAYHEKTNLSQTGS